MFLQFLQLLLTRLIEWHDWHVAHYENRSKNCQRLPHWISSNVSKVVTQTSMKTLQQVSLTASVSTRWLTNLQCVSVFETVGDEFALWHLV